jgi:hypothetical protein
VSALLLRSRYLRDQATGESASAATRQTGCGRGCVLWRSLHARGDTYSREEGHVTPAALSIVLSLRYSRLRDQATGESASVATRQTGCGSGHADSGAQDGDKAN